MGKDILPIFLIQGLIARILSFRSLADLRTIVVKEILIAFKFEGNMS